MYKHLLHMIPYVGYVDDVDIIHYIYSTPVFF
jgi:hypothetical protein